MQMLTLAMLAIGLHCLLQGMMVMVQCALLACSSPLSESHSMRNGVLFIALNAFRNAFAERYKCGF